MRYHSNTGSILGLAENIGVDEILVGLFIDGRVDGADGGRQVRHDGFDAAVQFPVVVDAVLLLELCEQLAASCFRVVVAVDVREGKAGRCAGAAGEATSLPYSGCVQFFRAQKRYRAESGVTNTAGLGAKLSAGIARQTTICISLRNTPIS